jgi:antitoxin CptB
MTDTFDSRRRRALWRARHRGTREMDWLLGRYAQARLEAMSAVELERFERLLALPDPELHAWIVAPSPAIGGELAAEIAAIRAFHGVGGSSG